MYRLSDVPERWRVQLDLLKNPPTKELKVEEDFGALSFAETRVGPSKQHLDVLLFGRWAVHRARVPFRKK
jgi:hypothetical protein